MSNIAEESDAKTVLQKSMAGQMETMHRIAAGAPIEDIFRSIINTIEIRFPDTVASIVLLDKNKEQDEFYWRNDVSLSDLQDVCKTGSRHRAETPWAMAAREKVQVVAVDLCAWGPIGETLTQLGLSACWSLPVLSSTGDAVGVLVLFHRNSAAPTEHELVILHHYGVVCAIAIEKHILRLENRYLKYHDYLTGLPNRLLFEERMHSAIQHSLARNLSFTFLVVGINDFREINSTWGYSIGDQILKEIADRLIEISNADVIVCRFGGDEFGVLLPTRSELETTATIKRMLHAIEQPIDINGHCFHISVSYGVSRFPEDGHDYDALIRNADASMSVLKNRAKSFT